MARPRILICEDDGLTALRLRTSLLHSGYDVVGEASNGEEAVAIAARSAPDAVLMDIRMPRLDGVSAVERILSLRPIPIVMLTAYSGQEWVDRALTAGAVGYLVKPIRDDQLDRVLRSVLREAAQEPSALAEGRMPP